MPLLSTFGAASARGFGNLSGIILPSDSLFNTVSFLSHFNGDNNGVNNVFDDSSTSNHTITASGNVTQGSFGPFVRPDGEWGIDFANNSGTRNGLKLCEGYQTELVMTGTITIEFWLFHRYVNGYQTFFGSGGGYSGWNSSTGHEIVAFCASNSSFYFQFWNGSTYISTDATAVTLNVGEWNHVAIVNNGGNWTTYLNGVGNTTTNYGNVSAISSTGTWASYIGTGNGGSDNSPCKGIMSNVRFVKGTAVYTSNFTPPTEPLTAITNTSSLVAQDNRFIDNSSHANTVTATGDIQVSAFGPFLTSEVYDAGVNGASLYAPIYTDYLRIPDSADFELDGDFSVEFWANLDADFHNALSIFIWANNDAQTQIGQGSANQLYFYRGAQIIQNTGVIAKSGSWNHVALCRSGSVLSYYCNGVRIGTASYTNTVDFSDGYVATYDPSSNQYAANGYMSDLRILKGSSAYDASQTTLTVPTAPLTAITNTKLLLNMADGQAIDSAAQTNLTLYGDAKISTAQSKFGGSSMLFDGTGDYATFNKITLSGDFTVEAYAYVSNIDTEQCLLGELINTRTQVFRLNHIQADSLLVFGSGNYIFGGPSNLNSALNGINSNTWFHMAVTRQSGVCRLFVNGVLKDTNSSDTSLLILDVIGNKGDGTQEWNGYADELRITNGVARYTSAFIAPTEPFPDKGQET